TARPGRRCSRRGRDRSAANRRRGRPTTCRTPTRATSASSATGTPPTLSPASTSSPSTELAGRRCGPGGWRCTLQRAHDCLSVKPCVWRFRCRSGHGRNRRLDTIRRQTRRTVKLAVSAVSLGDVAQAVRLRERAQLLQRLVLDLPDPLPRNVERAADLVERAGVLPIEPVAEL